MKKIMLILFLVYTFNFVTAAVYINGGSINQEGNLKIVDFNSFFDNRFLGKNISLLNNDSGFITEAPNDGSVYGRKNLGWEAIASVLDTNCAVSNSCSNIVYWQDANNLFAFKTDVNEWGAQLYYPLNSNPSGYLTSFTELDPIFLNWDYNYLKLKYKPSDCPIGYALSSLNGDCVELSSLVGYLTEADANNWYAFKSDVNSWGDARYVPLDRNITINGVTYDLTQNRTWTIPTADLNGEDLNTVMSRGNWTDYDLNLYKNNPSVWLTSLDGNFAQIVRDSNSNDLNFVNTVIAAGNSWALNFDSTSDKLALATPNALLTGTGDFTLTAWIKPTSQSTGLIMGNYGVAPCASGIEFYIGSDGVLKMYAGAAKIGGAYNVGVWNFVSVRRQGTTITFYQNGVEYSGGTTGHNISSSCNWVVGNGDNYTTERFIGAIDQVSVWNKALTTAQLNAIYNSGAGSIIAPDVNTLLIWEMSEGSGASVADTSGNNRTGTATATTWVEGIVTQAGNKYVANFLRVKNGQMLGSTNIIELGSLDSLSDIRYDGLKHTFQIGGNDIVSITSTGSSFNNLIAKQKTSSSSTGVITSGGYSFLHDFSHPTGLSAVPQGYNIILGRDAGNFTMGSTATNIVHGSENILIGRGTGNALTVGYRNIVMGQYSMNQATTAYNNVAIGFQALYGASSASGNTNVGIGYYPLAGFSTGTSNVAIGDQPLRSITTGSNNIGIGNESGRLIVVGTGNTASTDSIFIGRDTRPLQNTQSNQIVIGSLARGNGSNTVTIGNSSMTGFYLPADNYKIFLGAGNDASINYDGTDLLINPKEVGTGILTINNNVLINPDGGSGLLSKGAELEVYSNSNGASTLAVTNINNGTSAYSRVYIGHANSPTGYGQMVRYGSNYTGIAGSQNVLEIANYDSNIRLTANPTNTRGQQWWYTSGQTVINEDGLAQGDFRIEGDTNPNLFVTDAGLDKIAVRKLTPVFDFDVNGQIATDTNFVSKGMQGIDKNIVVINSVDLVGLSYTTCFNNFVGGILVDSNC